MPLPETGTLRTWYGGPPQPRLTLTSRRGDGHHYVKLERADGGGPVATLFVRDGERLAVPVPVGTYTMKVAAGTTWYGDAYLFGDGTICFATEEPLAFRVDVLGTREMLRGHSVELFTRPGGNLGTSPIAIEDF